MTAAEYFGPSPKKDRGRTKRSLSLIDAMYQTAEAAQPSSAMAFAWFCWDRNHVGPTTLSRIDWNGGRV